MVASSTHPRKGEFAYVSDPNGNLLGPPLVSPPPRMTCLFL